VYWPRGPKTIENYNPVILPRDIALAEGNRTRNLLFAQLSQISALRFVDGPVTIDASEAIECERAEKVNREKKTARATGNMDELIAIADEEVRDLRVANDRLRRDCEQLRRDHSHLAADLRITQDNLRATWSSSPQVAEPPTDLFHAALSPATVLAAVTDAAEMYKKTLVFHQKSLQSAKDSPFMAPEDVSYALLAMHEVCLLLQESRRDHKAIGAIEDLFAARGFTYRAHESETSMRGKMGDERKIVHNGKRIPIEKHLALGKGGPDTCLRIYFFDDEMEGKFVIGHVGRHKTNSQT
jgi:hypothetical protein